MNTLKSKMIMSYSLISLMIVIVLGLLFNYSIDKLFEYYAINQQKQRVENIIEQVNQQFDQESGLYNIDSLAVIGNAALQNGIIIHIQTVNKEIDWDMRQHKAQECLISLQHAEMNMHSRYPNFQGGYAEDTYDLNHNEQLAGYLTVGYYGPYSLGNNELILIKQLNMVIAGLGATFLLIAVISGILTARRITNPITTAIHAAQKIAEGNYGVQIVDSHSVMEMTRLITSINEMSRELEINEQRKKQFSADVAHELRTPLNNLQSQMEAMIDNIWEPSTNRLQGCHTEIIRLTQIVGQLQELYMLESEHTVWNKDYFDFTDFCDSVLTGFEMSIKCKDIELSRRIPVPAPMYGDMHRLKQCMVNLISNAIDYSPPGGNVVITYEKNEVFTFISVRNDGAVIPCEDLPHIFERFYRVDKSRSHMTGGMGVGLSITKAIVEAHNGTITAESKKGVGTLFTICLPYKI